MTAYLVCDTLSVLVEIVHMKIMVIHLWKKIHQIKRQEKKENKEEEKEECGSTGPGFWLPLH